MISPHKSTWDEIPIVYLKRLRAFGDPDLVVIVRIDSEYRDSQEVIEAVSRPAFLRGEHGRSWTEHVISILADGPFDCLPIVGRDVANGEEVVLFRPTPAPMDFPPDEVLVLAAEDFRGDMVIRSELDYEVCIQAAIEEAEWRIAEGEAGSVLVTGWGSALAILRRNFGLFDPYSPGDLFEVARFARPC